MRIIGYKDHAAGKLLTIIGGVYVGLTLVSFFGLFGNVSYFGALMGFFFSGLPFFAMLIVGIVLLSKKSPIITFENNFLSFVAKGGWQRVNIDFINEIRLSGSIIIIVMNDGFKFVINSVKNSSDVAYVLNEIVFNKQ